MVSKNAGQQGTGVWKTKRSASNVNVYKPHQEIRIPASAWQRKVQFIEHSPKIPIPTINRAYLFTSAKSSDQVRYVPVVHEASMCPLPVVYLGLRP